MEGKRQLRVRQARHRRATVLAATGFAVLAATGGTLLARPPGGGSPSGTAGGAPRAVAVSPAQFDGGRVGVGQYVRTTFVIANEGEGVLHLGRPTMQALQGCCPNDPVLRSSTLRPGARTELPVALTMHEGMAGPHLMSIQVPTDDPDVPSLEFRLKAEWVERR